MAKEIERKFLVIGDWRQKSIFTHIDQGYLNLDPNRTVRIRIETHSRLDICGDHERSAHITIKSKNIGIVRNEFEYSIPTEDAVEMLGMCTGHISKYRYYVYFKNKRWSVDQFTGLCGDLILAEIELEDKDEIIELPDWVGKEVSMDSRYYNSNIGRVPWEI